MDFEYVFGGGGYFQENIHPFFNSYMSSGSPVYKSDKNKILRVWRWRENTHEVNDKNTDYREK